MSENKEPLEKARRKARASMINQMVTSCLPSLATAVVALQMMRDQENEVLNDEARHHLQLVIDHLETANLFIAKFTCDLEPGAEGTAKITKVRDEMEKDVEQLKKDLGAKSKGRKIEVE